MWKNDRWVWTCDCQVNTSKRLNKNKQLNGYREKWRQCLVNRAINIGAYAIKRWSTK